LQGGNLKCVNGGVNRSELQKLGSELSRVFFNISFLYVLLTMLWGKSKIGFDDRWVTILGILGFTVLIPFIFFGVRFTHPPYFTWDILWTTGVITAVIWIGNCYIMIWSRSRYPLFEEVRKRMIVQSSVMLAFTLVANNSLGMLLDHGCKAILIGQVPGRTMADVIIEGNFAAIFCSMTMVAVYESIYFMGELRKSIEEKEMWKRESLQAQLSALKTQVNPHFLFNNLNTLSAVIPDNPGQAIDFVQQLSKVYRHILEVKNEQSILLKEELDVLKAYAFLLKTRFGDNLDISIRVADEKLRQRIVPLSLQILMENAIKHNIVSSAKPLKIDVFTANGHLVVSNNLQKKNQMNESTGIGLDNIRNRYKLLGNRQIEVQEGPSSFIVSIPLIEL
jgi:two-component system LytT family sensor kinase